MSCVITYLLFLDFAQHVCHVIDFGLAKKYQDPRSGRHIPYLEVSDHLTFHTSLMVILLHTHD